MNLFLQEQKKFFEGNTLLLNCHDQSLYLVYYSRKEELYPLQLILVYSEYWNFQIILIVCICEQVYCLLGGRSHSHLQVTLGANQAKYQTI
jgi:hypothetical protein